MGNGIKHVDLILENCEYLRVPGNAILDMNISRIEESISRIAMNAIRKNVTAKDIFIQVRHTVDETILGTGLFDPIGEQEEVSPLTMLAERDDITQVTVTWENDKTENFLVNWDFSAGNEYTNAFQSNIVNGKGGVMVVISDRLNHEFAEYADEVAADFLDLDDYEDMCNLYD